MANISTDNKTIARYVAKAFGGTPSVREYLHDSLPLKIDILSAKDQPDSGLTSYGTLGLSDTALKWGHGEFSTRIEFCAAAESAFEHFPNIVSSASFNVMRTQMVCHPGTVMPNYVAEYYKDTLLPHLYFTSPFPWEDAVKSIDLPNKKVSWLLCFPISEAEYAFLKTHGEEKFEDMLESAGVNIFDLSRHSAC
jgi:Suppressor of fused protein (SUFU)